MLYRLHSLGLGLLFLAGPAGAALEVDVVTNRGTITAELDEAHAPMAVANFITLAEGTRSWIDSANGAVRDEAFYDGLGFHRVVNEAGVKLLETGSRTGVGSDGPGYTFPDELGPGLTHQPYVLAMANDGPNTNGSRCYFTGNIAMPERDGVNTVFGSVPGAASRAVIDAILAAGAGTTTITSMQVRRSSPEAESFDEHGVALPVVRAIAPGLRVTPGQSTEAGITQGARSVVQAWDSADLAAWVPGYRGFVAATDTPPGPFQVIDDAGSPAQFYRFSMVDYPSGDGPSDFANRTLTTVTPQTDTIIYQFDATGRAGIYENIVFGMPFFAGQFEVRGEEPDVHGPHSFRILLYLFDEELGGSPFNLIRGAFDSADPTLLTGRHFTTFLSPSLQTVFEDRGALTLTQP